MNRSAQQAGKPKPLQSLPAKGNGETVRIREWGFFNHLRPIGRIVETSSFRSTYHLGFWAVLLLVIELVTGLLLMAYYEPTPGGAYLSIHHLETRVPFGHLLRGLHRLGGDLLLMFTFAHLIKVLFNGGSSRAQRFTWMSGGFLFFFAQAIAFSGYLLPWDQRSYWAVTVGTSLFGHLPYIGEAIQTGLRGGGEMGAGGLLRFYTLHVVVLPAGLLLVLAAHCFQVVARRRKALVPPSGGQATPSDAYWPTASNRGLELTLVSLVVLLAVCGLFYQAPLGPEADPASTPPHPLAPWFFLWVQGLLVGRQQIAIGLMIPVGLAVLVLFLPWLPRVRPLQNRTALATSLGMLLALLSWSSYRARQVELPADSIAEPALSVLAPAGSLLPILELEYAALAVGVYPLVPGSAPSASPVDELRHDIDSILDRARQAGQLGDYQGLLIVDQPQDRLKQLTVRIRTRLPQASGYDSQERSVYLYDLETPQ